jgi:hypothetical protein
MENEIKKDLYKSKEMARLSHYDGDKGALIYQVKIFGKLHEFPIYVFETDNEMFEGEDRKIILMAADLKGAKFFVEIKGSDLNRWISKAIDKGDLLVLEASSTGS